MVLLKNETFICIDCESTGLDTDNDRIIEVAAATFKDGKIIDTFETLVDPGRPIPEESTKIHNITDEMVKGKPKIEEVLPEIFKLLKRLTIVGHGIPFDIALLAAEAKRHDIATTISQRSFLDTLRLARHYGQAPTNSLEALRSHFNIPQEGAHRAMSDVIVNIAVFEKLVAPYTKTKQVVAILEKPVELKKMPLGKHKGRFFKEIPLEYLQWAAGKDFDQDLLYSIRSELKRRKKGGQFSQASNPFMSL